jgi:hypothetical protein
MFATLVFRGGQPFPLQSATTAVTTTRAAQRPEFCLPQSSQRPVAKRLGRHMMMQLQISPKRPMAVVESAHLGVKPNFHFHTEPSAARVLECQRRGRDTQEPTNTTQS